jgi:alpha-mannosidase
MLDNARARRLREVLETRLLPAVLKDSAPLELTAFCVRGEPISYAEAVRGSFAPIAVGDAWGPPWSTTWFRVRGSVPHPWVGQKVVALFDLGYLGQTGFTCEALAWKDGVPWRGVDPNHS